MQRSLICRRFWIPTTAIMRLIPSLASSIIMMAVNDLRDIDDLADLNGQMNTATVTRTIAVDNATPQTVKLTEAEVDRLGEGRVDIEATQTDNAGNCMQAKHSRAASLSIRSFLTLRLQATGLARRLMVRTLLPTR